MTAIFPFIRTERQVSELRRFCQLWRDGVERFWAFDDVLKALSRSGSLGFFAADAADGVWRGVILADVGPFTTDLLYVFVVSEERKSGTGRRLVERLITDLKSRSEMEALLLEVRANNIAAQRLYESLSMARIDCRKAYYANGDDALIYRLELSAKVDA